MPKRICQACERIARGEPALAASIGLLFGPVWTVAPAYLAQCLYLALACACVLVADTPSAKPSLHDKRAALMTWLSWIPIAFMVGMASALFFHVAVSPGRFLAYLATVFGVRLIKSAFRGFAQIAFIYAIAFIIGAELLRLYSLMPR